MTSRKSQRRRERLHCQRCGKDVDALPYIYGEPSPELAEEAMRGEVILGGCIVQPWRWACPDCGRPIPSDDDNWKLVARPGEDLEEVKREWLKMLDETVEGVDY